MSNVIAFPEKDEPHISGAARCLSCKHEWLAVAPVGTYILECPSCGCDGAMVGAVHRGGLHWQCQCGCDLYRIDEQGAYCINCAERQRW